MTLIEIHPGCGMSVAQAALRLGVSPRTVYRLCHSRELDH